MQSNFRFDFSVRNVAFDTFKSTSFHSYGWIDCTEGEHLGGRNYVIYFSIVMVITLLRSGKDVMKHLPLIPYLYCFNVKQGSALLAVVAGRNGLDTFSLICPVSLYLPCLWEASRFRLKYCLYGPLNPKQPTNQSKFL